MSKRLVELPKVSVDAGVEVLSITKTVGGSVQATLYLRGIDYVELSWGSGVSSVVDKPKKHPDLKLPESVSECAVWG